MKRISITFEDGAVTKIEDLTKAERRSFSNLVCILVDEALATREKAEEKHQAESA